MNLGATVDLHTHSLCSDGSLTPSELIELAAQAGIGVLALTDHDTVAGLDEAQRAADGIGMRLVPGVEISAAWHFQTVHVLGLWIDPASARLRDALGPAGGAAPSSHAQDVRVAEQGRPARRRAARGGARRSFELADTHAPRGGACRRAATSARPTMHFANTWARANARMPPPTGLNSPKSSA